LVAVAGEDLEITNKVSMGLSVNGKPPVSKTGTPRSSRGRPDYIKMKDKLNLIIKFLKETRAETKKVVWPDRRYVAVATLIILVLVAITGVYVMTVDFIFSKIFGLMFR
jgi:preprotein translocase subunit SecE